MNEYRTQLIALLCLLLQGMCTSAFAQLNREPIDRIRRDIKTMLPEGEVVAHIMDSVKSDTDKEMVPSGRLSFSIASDGKEIWFYTYNNSPLPARILDKVSIDLERNIIIMDGKVLDYAGERKNGTENPWRGHHWSFKEPDDPVLYTFTLAKLEGGGQTFLHIQISETENGWQKKQLNVPLLF